MYFLLLILFLLKFFIMGFSYIYSILTLALFILFLVLVLMKSLVLMKVLVILVYLGGVVIFILYISCLCFVIKNNFSVMVFLSVIVWVYSYDVILGGLELNMFYGLDYLISVGILFNMLIYFFSFSLFKMSGSLRF